MPMENASATFKPQIPEVTAWMLLDALKDSPYAPWLVVGVCCVIIFLTLSVVTFAGMQLKQEFAAAKLRSDKVLGRGLQNLADMDALRIDYEEALLEQLRAGPWSDEEKAEFRTSDEGARAVFDEQREGPLAVFGVKGSNDPCRTKAIMALLPEKPADAKKKD